MGDWINDNGDWFSFLGLILTFLTFVGVLLNKRNINKLNRKNFKVNRMPENLNDLKNISNSVSDLILDFDDKKKEIKSELSKISPILKSLKKSLNSGEIEHLKTLNSSIKNLDYWKIEGEKIKWFKKHSGKEKEMTERLVNDIEIKLTRLITDIENIGKDNLKNLVG